MTFTNPAALEPFRKHSAIGFQALPARNRLAPVMPFVKLSVAFALGALASILLLVVTP